MEMEATYQDKRTEPVEPAMKTGCFEVDLYCTSRVILLLLAVTQHSLLNSEQVIFTLELRLRQSTHHGTAPSYYTKHFCCKIDTV
jgi:hypothetical protein